MIVHDGNVHLHGLVGIADDGELALINVYIGIFFECQLHKIQLCIVLSRVYLLYALRTGLKVGPDYLVLDVS